MRTLPPGTLLRFDATDYELWPNWYKLDVDVRYRFYVLGGRLAGRCFWVADNDGNPPAGVRPLDAGGRT